MYKKYFQKIFRMYMYQKIVRLKAEGKIVKFVFVHRKVIQKYLFSHNAARLHTVYS